MDESRVAGVLSGREPRGLLSRRARTGFAARLLVALLGVLSLCAVFAAAAFANAPNPTSIKVDGYSVKGSEVDITISGTWTWNVPNGAQKDCNDSRIGVGYAIGWGDNTEHPLKVQGSNELIYVGTATDDWVHSVTVGTQTVDGPFKKGPATLEESMLGETPEGTLFGFGDEQGISTGATSAVPTEENAKHWFSNCGPTEQSVVNGQTIGNSDPGNPEQGFPNGTWGPISHVYKTAGPFTICPVMYDPHGNEVGQAAQNANEITASRNGDNSIESNGNPTACVQKLTVPKLTTKSSPIEGLTGQSLKDEAKIEGNNPQGSISWSLYGPFSSAGVIKETSCTGKPVFESSAVTVNGNNTYTSPATTVSTAGVYQWVASYTSSNSNNNLSVGPVGCGEAAEQVSITPAPKPEFTIEKLQKLTGEFTKSELTGKLGQTVSYEVVVKNAGNTTLKFESLIDPNCAGIAPAGTTELAAGKEETFTCSHVLSATGKYANVGTIETTEKLKHPSNEVVVNVPAEPNFSIEKLQEIKGSGKGFTKEELSAEKGQTVDYELVVANTGNVKEKFGALVDAKCTSISPAGETELEVGAKETFTCEHVLTKADEEAGLYENSGKITGNGVEKTSNVVKVKVLKENFTIIKEQEIKGSGKGFTKEQLSGKVGETVLYKITVSDTGETTLKFGALKDAKCTNISPAGETTLEAGKSEAFTCEHLLTKADAEANGGIYENVALIKGGEKEKESPPVKVKVEEPAFTIEKLQKLTGEFTKSELTGKLGQTVSYEIVVKNTGNTTLKFESLIDPNCAGIAPAGTTELAAGKEETFTCSHVLSATGKYANVGTIETTEKLKHPSNEVVVNVPAEPNFSIEKLQEIKGSGKGFTKEELSAEKGQTVDYELVVANTGNVKEKFGALVDAKCTSISPAGETELEVGAKETFTCEHVLTKADEEAGLYENSGKITGNGVEKTSNVVKVKVLKENFTIIKEQEIKGSGKGFTKEQLSGKVGETVLYKITVSDTGETTLKFGALKDAKCTNISPAGETTLEAGKSEAFTCEHLLTKADAEANGGIYENVALIKGGEKEKESPPVKVKVEEPAFTIEKLQKLTGEFTKSELTGKLGQTVSYEIVVKNTGNTTLKFESLIDPNCAGIAPAGTTELAAGKEETFTCSHVLSATGKYANVGTIETTEKLKHPSNEVVVNVPAEPNFSIEKLQEIKGSGKGFTKEELSAEKGQTVDYELVVTNTGNVKEKFGALVDAKCTSISPAGETELEVGAKETFTCEHVLTKADEEAGLYENSGKITGNGVEKTSNVVKVKILKENFTIIKEQEIKGSGKGFTKEQLSGKVGETVLYKITVSDTGETTLKFGALKDAKCTNISPAGETTLEAGKSEAFTCEHLLTKADAEANGGIYENVALIKGGEKEKESPPVKVKVEEPAFTIEKLQEIKGSGKGFTKEELSAEKGQTVDYELVVANTGNVKEKFGALVDAKCTSISPAGETELEVGAKETFTCEHVLTKADEEAGLYENSGKITGNGVEKTSNVVKVKVLKENFTIIKEQEIKGSGKGFTKEQLSGKVGETVLYKITVSDTGETTLKFGALKDAKCTNISPAGETTLEAGKSEAFTCEHLLTKADAEANGGIYENVALIKGGEKEKESPPVKVKVEEPAFTIEKLQKLTGEFTKSELTGKLGQTVSYEIVVKNTGNTTLKFESLIDPNCAGIAPAGTTELAAGKEETFTCSHVLSATGKYANVGTIETTEKLKHPSNEVVVNVPAEGFQVVKKQRFAGEANYTEAKLSSSKLPITVEYEIIVKNTGETKLKLEALTDFECTTAPVGPLVPELAPGAEAVEYTCSREITAAGTYTNVAVVKGNEKEEPSNKVEVKVEKEGFEVIKKQRFAGEANYSEAKLTTRKIPSTVEYEIIVKNTGETKLKVEKLSDPECSTVPVGPQVAELAPGAEAVEYTCSRELTAAGVYTNVALVTANGKEEPSNKVEVKLEKQAFEDVKEQKLSGSTAGYTKEKLTGKIGETIDYRITATNTGEAPETFPTPLDPGCSTLSGGPTGPVASGQSATWTCERLITAGGVYENVATVTGNEEPHPTNKVVVEVPKQEPKAVCAISEPSIVLHGASGSKRKPFKVRISSLGIKEITFFLDGKKLKKLTASQAKNGQFEVKIDPGKLRFGAHKVSVKTIMTDPTCANIARAAVFVHPKPPKITPKFTG